ncbi:hypothetical protein BMF94_2938 [Rhodotorula taiwanensis]|uniref:Fe2OG dioxygenase domain-containing protein n=1 Tax=Rhodotorula taiwanensis TaxID=741276 RepID=A0A2S5BBH3_9BASI|nr:hypothetical protein BMF94_2938 [Rhodotorula taiwanensis]
MVVLKTGLGERLISNDVEGKAFSELPVIDLQRLQGTNEDRKALAAEIQEVGPVFAISVERSPPGSSAIASGFFYISNHGVPQDVLDNAFGQAKQFFSQPMEKKLEIDQSKGNSFKGYVPLKGENVDPESRGDMHEAVDFGPEQGAAMSAEQTSGNMWPSAEDLPDFRPAIERAINEILALGQRLFPLFALALDLPEDFFADKLKNPGSAMRILHYPPQYGPVDTKEIGIGAHTDYECFTILAQHGDVQALQVLNSAGEWVQAPPKEGTFVLNIGDQLQRITNGLFKSTVHRAINRTGQDRMSIPFFFGLDYDAMLETLPSCVSADRPAMYEPITAGEYVEKRMKETYVKAPKAEEVKAPKAEEVKA